MSRQDKEYAELLLLWARTLDQHRLSWEAWVERKHQTGGKHAA